MKNGIFLFNLNKSIVKKKVNLHGYNCPNVPKFPILTKLNILQSNKYEMFHLIDINKIMKGKKNKRRFLGNYYKEYKKLKKIYKNELKNFNKELLKKYNESYSNFDPDCIIKPESNNNWLREGLAENFSDSLNINIIEAKKNKECEFSSIRSDNEIPKDFKFILDFKKSIIRKALIIDDMKGTGRTMRLIKSEFDPEVRFVEVFYVKV